MGKGWRLAAVFTAVVTLAGCSSAASDTSSPQPIALPPGTSQAFELIDFASYQALENSINTYSTHCVEAKGFTLAESGGGGKPEDAIVQTRASFGPITEAEARKQGLHTGPVPEPANVKTAPPDVDAANAYADCYNEALNKIGNVRKVEGDFLAFIDDVTNGYYAAMRPDITTAMVAERKCVAKNGWTVVPGQDITDTDISSAQVFGVQTATDTLDANGQAIGYTPLARETDLALALMNCRVQLGNPDKLLAAAKTVEAQVMGKNEARLDELNKQMADLAKAAPGKLA